MRPILFGSLVVILLMFAVAVLVFFDLARRSQGTAIGLNVIVNVALSPIFWVLYVGGFTATYWLTAHISFQK
jgi:hypothetical protein